MDFVAENLYVEEVGGRVAGKIDAVDSRSVLWLVLTLSDILPLEAS
jgi:hypothetical protein